MDNLTKKQKDGFWALKALKSSSEYLEAAYSEAAEALGALEAIGNIDATHRMDAMMAEMATTKRKVLELAAELAANLPQVP